MSLPKIVIVIPCFNGWSYTRNCINSILKSSYSNYEILIVNDGSTDNTSISLAEEFPEIFVYNGDGNLWWSESMNVGMEVAFNRNADFVLVLNNDVEISPNTIDVLVETASENKNAIIGSLILDISNTNILWSTGGKMIWPCLGEVQMNDMSGFDNNLKVVDWNPGMGTLISFNIFKKLKGFDSKNFPQYMGDTDFCLRAKKIGIKTIITSRSILFNNIDNTGGVNQLKKQFTIKDLIDVFQSYRSPDFLKARLKFIYRHCPTYLFLPALLCRYSKLFFYLIKKSI